MNLFGDHGYGWSATSSPSGSSSLVSIRLFFFFFVFFNSMLQGRWLHQWLCSCGSHGSRLPHVSLFPPPSVSTSHCFFSFNVQLQSFTSGVVPNGSSKLFIFNLQLRSLCERDCFLVLCRIFGGSVLLVLRRTVPEIKAKQVPLLLIQSIGSIVWLTSLLVRVLLLASENCAGKQCVFRLWIPYCKNVVEQCQQQLHREEKLRIFTAYVVHIISRK